MHQTFDDDREDEGVIGDVPIDPKRERQYTSPWWEQYWVARLLHHAAADGATIKDYADYFDDEAFDADPDEWFLDIAFAVPRPDRATVRFSSDRGRWVLLVDTHSMGEAQAGDLEHQMATAYAVSLAAKLCRDLNSLLMRQQRREPRSSALSEELEALMGDRDISPAEFAAQLGVTHGVLASKMKGATAWSATDLLRAARTLDREDGTDVLCRLLGAVS